MLWLREQACHVLGIELSETACEAFFVENGGAVERVFVDGFYQREKDEIALLCGDFFKLSADKLAGVGAVYDRAALIALPKDLRHAYAEKMIEWLPKGVKVLLVTLEFEGEAGPPFSVGADEVRALFSDRFVITKLSSESPGEGAGRTETAWLLSDRTLGR
jgi:thiopurine S-methyltransferase